MNLPNKLTILRVIMIPFFVAALLYDGGANQNMRYVAAALFIIASLTDMLDGKIARARNLVTNFGKFMDPLADKLLVCSAMICMIPLGKLQAWFVIVIIAREFMITGFRTLAVEQNIVIAAGFWGKLKTICQMFMIIFLLLNFNNSVTIVISHILIWASLILAIVSAVDYIVNNKQVLK